MGRRARWSAMAALMLLGAGCVPDQVSAPTRLQVRTDLEWCGGVMPPPGEPRCHTNPVAAPIVVLQGRQIVASATTTAAGGAVVDVPPGRLTVRVVEPPGYMVCDEPIVTAVAGEVTQVVQTCHVNAP